MKKIIKSLITIFVLIGFLVATYPVGSTVSGNIWLDLNLKAPINPSGKYLKDDGTWDTPTAGPSENTKQYIPCDYMGMSLTQLTGDTNNWCPPYMFNEDANAVLDPSQTSASVAYARIRTGATGVTSALGDGASITLHQSGATLLNLASTSPVMEVIARIGLPQNASSSDYQIGFNMRAGNSDLNGSMFDGCYFNASSTAPTGNWYLVSDGSGANMTVTNTGVASSTNITGVGDFYKFRIEATTNSCVGYITNLRTGQVTQTSTTGHTGWANSVQFLAGVENRAAGLTKELHVRSVRVWLNSYGEPQ